MIPVLLLTACGGSGGGQVREREQASSGASADVRDDRIGSLLDDVIECRDARSGEGPAAAKIQTFLAAVTAFGVASGELSMFLELECRDMGTNLGMSFSELRGGPTRVCVVVAAQVRTDPTRHQVQVYSEPASCQASVDDYARCVSECDPNVDPREVDTECVGDYTAGRQVAECHDPCPVEVDNTCSQPAPDGFCDDLVHGDYDPLCGSGCSYTYVGPRCDGEIRASSIDPACSDFCAAAVTARSQCAPGRVETRFVGVSGGNPYAQNLASVVRHGLGELLVSHAKLQSLADVGGRISRAGHGMNVPDERITGASICANRALVALPELTAQVSESLNAATTLITALLAERLRTHPSN